MAPPSRPRIEITRVVALSSIVVAIGCASLIGIGDLGVQDASVQEASVEAGEASCGWPGPTAGLVGYYAFEEQTGTTSNDCSGSPRAAILKNNDAGWSSAGYLGGAIRVSDNSSGHFGCMVLPYQISYQIPPTPFSISAFVRLEPELSGSSQRFIVARSSSGTAGPGWGVTMLPDASTVSFKVFNVLDGGDYDLSIPGSWLDGAWHHIVVMYPGDAGATLTIDDASTTDPNVTPTIKVDVNTGVSFGCRGDGNYPLYGAIDEVRIFDHVLDASELQALDQK